VPDAGFGLTVTMNATDVLGPAAARWDNISDGIIRLALGRQPFPPAVYGDLLDQNAKLAYALGVLIAVAASVWALRARRRRRLAIATATLINVAAVGLALIYAPSRAGDPLLVFVRLFPDVGLMTVVGVGVAIVFFGLLLRQAYRERHRAERPVPPVRVSDRLW
jgi:hypothetical protein